MDYFQERKMQAYTQTGYVGGRKTLTRTKILAESSCLSQNKLGIQTSWCRQTVHDLCLWHQLRRRLGESFQKWRGIQKKSAVPQGLNATVQMWGYWLEFKQKLLSWLTNSPHIAQYTQYNSWNTIQQLLSSHHISSRFELVSSISQE